MQFVNKYGPCALVAGGSDGLGAAFAEALARRGLNLVLIARNKARLDETAKRIRDKYSVDVSVITCDLAYYENAKNLIQEHICADKNNSYGASIGILVYNAAFAPIGLFENTDEESLSLAAAVNVRTPLLLTKFLSAQMIQNRRGGIVLMSSLAGAQGSPNLAAYAATKSFNAVLAEGLWKELKPHGVDVIGCCAGAVLTPGYQQAEKVKKAPGTLPAKEVAEQTLKALGKGPVVIPGTINKIARFVLTRLLTRKAAINIMSNNTGNLL